jgi:hypothetical protein
VCKPEMQWSRKCVGAGTLAHFQDRAKEVTIMLVAAGQWSETQIMNSQSFASLMLPGKFNGHFVNITMIIGGTCPPPLQWHLWCALLPLIEWWASPIQRLGCLPLSSSGPSLMEGRCPIHAG